MIFKEFNPLKDEMLRIIDNDGKVINQELMPDLDDETIVKAYREMLLSVLPMKWQFLINVKDECIHSHPIRDKKLFI